MRIGVNVRMLTGGRLEGIGSFTYETLRLMVLDHPEHDFVFFFDRKWDNKYIFSANVIPVHVRPIAIHPILWYFWFEWTLPFYLKKYKVDVFLSMDGFNSIRTKVPSCLVIHDLAFFHYPNYFKRRTALYYKIFVPLFLKKAKSIAVVSEFTKSDVQRYLSKNSIPISVVYCAASRNYHPVSDSVKRKLNIELTGGAPYFLFVGALHPRKNVVALIDAFEKFKKETGLSFKLVIVGRLAWKSDSIKTKIEQFPYPEDLIYLGSVTSEKLPIILASSYCLVYPSLFEGFGIPILEAMLCDVPVITSNCASMPEVGGDAALYVNPHSVDDINIKLQKIATDEKLRDELISKGRFQRNKFSWENTSSALWTLIQETKLP